MRRLAFLVMATGLALGLAAGTAAASTTRIGPNQLFAGFVNHSRPTATIQMACFGAIHPGETGNPMPGQTVSVQRTIDVPGGNTGSAASSIVVTIGPAAAANAGIVFTHYGTKAIPTTLVLPCAGQTTAWFRPMPAATNSRPDRVTVNLASQP